MGWRCQYALIGVISKKTERRDHENLEDLVTLKSGYGAHHAPIVLCFFGSFLEAVS